MAGQEVTSLVAGFPTEILDIAFGFIQSEVLVTGCRLGIFDELERRGKSRLSCSFGVVALSLKLDPAATRRFLDACVCLKLLNRRQGDQDCEYSNTPTASAFLTRTASGSISNAIVEHAAIRDSIQKNISTVLQIGQDRFAATKSSVAYTGAHQDRPETMEAFGSFLKLAAPALVSVFDLSQFGSACDIAGGIGELAIALRKIYPTMEVSVMERPEVVVYGTKIKKNEDEEGHQLFTFVTGDIFEDPFPSADLYCLGHLCMYLRDKQLSALFQKIFDHLPPGGGFLVYESILNDEKTGPLLPIYRDIALLYWEMLENARRRNTSPYCMESVLLIYT